MLSKDERCGKIRAKRRILIVKRVLQKLLKEVKSKIDKQRRINIGR